MTGSPSAGPSIVVDGVVVRVRPLEGDDASAVVVDDGGTRWPVVGELGELRVGTPVRLFAAWSDGEPGRRLRALDYQLRVPEGEAAIERFLASGFFPGIGADLAARLVACFGADVLRVIETSPRRLAEVRGLGAARASRLVAAWAEHRHLQDVATMLRGHGVPAAFTSRMVRRHGGDVMWLPTPPRLIDAMLDLARVTAADHVVDLGAGDGTTVIAAARRGARAVGVDCNPELVHAARQRATEAGVADRATFDHGDLFAFDLAAATVITLFLLPGVNLALRPRLLALRPGTRIVSNTWGMGDWIPDEKVTLDDEHESPWRTALLWIVPATG